jgi:hypothetical protein
MEYLKPMVTISLDEYLLLKDNINTENVTDEDYLELFNIIKEYYKQHVAFENGTTSIIPESFPIFIKHIQNKFYIKKNNK